LQSDCPINGILNCVLAEWQVKANDSGYVTESLVVHIEIEVEIINGRLTNVDVDVLFETTLHGSIQRHAEVNDQLLQTDGCGRSNAHVLGVNLQSHVQILNASTHIGTEDQWLGEPVSMAVEAKIVDGQRAHNMLQSFEICSDV
jgi:hypothetical protein